MTTREKPGPKPGPRFPFAPLQQIDGRSSSQWAEALGVTAVMVRRWRSRGLSVRQADEITVAIGLHPLDVWPDFYDDVA